MQEFGGRADRGRVGGGAESFLVPIHGSAYRQCTGVVIALGVIVGLGRVSRECDKQIVCPYGLSKVEGVCSR